MINKLGLIYALILLVVFSGCATTPKCVTENDAETQVVIGTGGIKGVYFPIGGAICRIVKKKLKEKCMFCGTESTKGSVDNINALMRDDLKYGIARSERIYEAYLGHTRWKGQPVKELRTVF